MTTMEVDLIQVLGDEEMIMAVEVLRDGVTKGDCQIQGLMEKMELYFRTLSYCD